jgi:hypothetical protein
MYEGKNVSIIICSLFNDAFSVTKTLQRLMEGDKWMMNLERIWKEAVVA